MTLARRATALDRPEPMVMIRQPDGEALATAQGTAADRKPRDGAATPPDQAQAPELERLGDQIAELSARIDAATYELLCQLREFDRRHGWEGWRSCAHWLNWRTGLDLGGAREKLRVAAALADLNHIAAAMARGQLSYSKVRALTRVATPATEARLLAVALGATASHVERLVRAWRRADRDAQPDAEEVLLASRASSMQVDEDGMVVLRGRLTPEVGAVLLRAVEATLEQVPASAEGGESTIAQRRADALGLVAESALAGGLDPGNSADRFQVTVHVQADTLAAREAADEARRVAAETRSTDTAASEPPSTATVAAVHVAADTRSASPAAAELHTNAAHEAPHVAAEARSTDTAAPEPPTAATVAAPHVAAETRSAGTAESEPPSAVADAASHVAAEARSTDTAASVLPSAATVAAPHVAAETQSASPAAAESPSPAAVAARRVAVETRSTGTAVSAPPGTAAVAARHVAAETWEHGVRPDASTMPGTASAVERPLRDMRSRNGRGRVTADASPLRDQSARSRRDAKLDEGRCAGSAARSPLREVAQCSDGARDPSTPEPATVATAHTSAETLQANAAASEWAAQDTDLDAGLAVIEQAGGLHLGREAARRVACDAGVVVLNHGADDDVLDVGRRTRTVPSALRRALQSRDRSQCQFPGCDSRRCDAHHVEHWADGGETRLHNLVLLCRFPPPRSARSGLSGGSGRRRWAVPVPAPGRRAVAGGAADVELARDSAGGGRHQHRPPHRHPRVVRRVAGPDGGARRVVGAAGYLGTREFLTAPPVRICQTGAFRYHSTK